MTNTPYRKRLTRFKRNPSPLEGPAVPFNASMAAARSVMRAIPGQSAIAGGLAMQILGSTRATKDVDIVANDLPVKFKPRGSLSFGGASYLKGTIPVDVIVRDDNLKGLYRLALYYAATHDGHRVLAPPHLAVIKHMAGRGKDMLDLAFLIRHKLFKKSRAIDVINDAFPSEVAWYIREDFSAVYDEIVFENGREKSK